MRKLGKFLVFCNLVMSLLFLGWSMALFTQRMDWAPHKNIFTGEVDPETGQLNQRLEDVQLLVEHRDQSEARWQTDTITLPRLFDQRDAYLRFYENEVHLAKTGTDTNNKPAPNDWPVRTLVRSARDPMLLEMDPAKRPAVTDSRKVPVRAIGEYDNANRELTKELAELQMEISKLIEENQKLTEQIAGTKDMLGVRGQLEQRLSYKKLWEDEIAYLRPHLVNQLINIEEQKRRLAALDGRLKELRGEPVVAPVAGK